MTEEQHDLVIKLREQVRTLISLYEKAKSDLKKSKEEKVELVEKIKINEKEYETLEKKYNTLKLAKVINGENGEAHEAKAKVNKIVREIDKCIALLNK